MSAPALPFDEAHALKCDLAAEVLRSSASLRLRVMGSSMLPSVWPGDTLLIERVEANAVTAGDLVLFGRNRRLFVHRVVRVGANGDATILTRGDAMLQPDPPMPSRNLLGRVSYIVRYGRLIEPKKTLGLPQRAVASLIQRSEIAARVAIGVSGVLQGSRRRNSARISHPTSYQTHNPVSKERVVPCQS
jgi:signal peptidase I